MLEVRAAIQSQAEWRSQKADEYPEDVRNANSALYLNAMGKWLEASTTWATDLPRLSAAYDALGALVVDPEVYILSGELSQVLGRCGFRQPAEAETPENFIRDLDTYVAEVLEDQVHEIEKAAKSREQRLRRLSTKFGLKLVKGRPRYADSEPGYMLLDVETGGASLGSGSFGFEASLDEVEAYLREPDQEVAK
jgi:hypothetical protein